MTTNAVSVNTMSACEIGLPLPYFPFNSNHSHLPGATRGNCSQDIVVQLFVNIFFCERVIAPWNYMVAPQCDEIFKQKVNDCVQHVILQKFTNFHAIRSWKFRIFAMRWWPRFFAPPCIKTMRVRVLFLHLNVLLKDPIYHHLYITHRPSTGIIMLLY